MKASSSRSRKQLTTVDQYIKAFPTDVTAKLSAIRKIVKKVAPKAEEGISYQMPGYKYHGPLVYFAAFKKHIGFYPVPSAIKVFQKELAGYKTAKGSIQFPLDKPLPLSLITKIIKYRVKENMAKKRRV